MTHGLSTNGYVLSSHTPHPMWPHPTTPYPMYHYPTTPHETTTNPTPSHPTSPNHTPPHPRSPHPTSPHPHSTPHHPKPPHIMFPHPTFYYSFPANSTFHATSFYTTHSTNILSSHTPSFHAFSSHALASLPHHIPQFHTISFLSPHSMTYYSMPPQPTSAHPMSLNPTPRLKPHHSTNPSFSAFYPDPWLISDCSLYVFIKWPSLVEKVCVNHTHTPHPRHTATNTHLCTSQSWSELSENWPLESLRLVTSISVFVALT